MNSLPNELLIQIASHLELEPPSVIKFSNEPSLDLTSSSEAPLKALSLVSWHLRKIVLPILFSYSRINLETQPQWVPVDARLIENMQGHLTSLSSHELQVHQTTRSKFKSSPTLGFDEPFDIIVDLVRIQEGDDFLKSLPNILWFPHLPSTFTEFAHFITQYDLKHHLKSLVVFTDKEYELHHIAIADAPLRRAVNEIWKHIFLRLEPSRVVVAAPPTTLAGLLDTPMFGSDAWAFDMKMHYIELRQLEPYCREQSSTQCLPVDSALIHRRPWSHLAYNEGSSISAYSTYEYFLKEPPKMLFLILFRLAKEGQDSCNLCSFSFIGIFPFSIYITTIIRALHGVKTLRKVQFQLAPGPENNLLSSPERMRRAQPVDIWLEWNESYKVIATFLVLGDFPDGTEFVSEDCREPKMAIEVEEYVQKLQERGSGWRRVSPGTWVRDHSLDYAPVSPVA